MKTIDSNTLRNTYAELLLKESSLLMASEHGLVATSETGDTVFAFTEDDNHKWSVHCIAVDGEEVDSSCLELDTMLEVSIALLRTFVYGLEKCYVDLHEKLPEEYAPGEVKAATVEGFNLEMELDGKSTGLATA